MRWLEALTCRSLDHLDGSLKRGTKDVEMPKCAGKFQSRCSLSPVSVAQAKMDSSSADKVRTRRKSDFGKNFNLDPVCTVLFICMNVVATKKMN